MITRLRLWVIVFLLGGVLPSLIAQTFTEQKNTYPLSADGSKYVVNGFIPFSPMNDENIYANALLWTIKNVCSAQRDGITEVSIPARVLVVTWCLLPRRMPNKRIRTIVRPNFR